MKSTTRHRLPILAIYVFRKILFPTLVLVLVLTFLLSLERVLSLVEMVTSSGLPAYNALALIVYLIPNYLGVAVLVGVLMGTLIAVRGLHDRSELVVMRSFGMSMRRMQRPILTLALLLAVLMAGLTAYIQPYALYNFRERANKVRTGNIFAGLQDGMFHKAGEDITIRVNHIHPDGLTFDGFFLAIADSPSTRCILTAETAQRIPQQNVTTGVAAKLRLTNGSFIRERDGPDGKAITFQMTFEECPISIPMDKIVKHSGPRGASEREWTTPELIAGVIPGQPTEVTSAEIGAELHSRIVSIFSLPLLCLLATPLALIGSGRGGRASGIAIAVVVFIAYEKMTGLGDAMAEDGKIHPILGLWIPWCALAILTLLLFRHYSGDRGRVSSRIITNDRKKTVNAESSRGAGGRP